MTFNRLTSNEIFIDKFMFEIASVVSSLKNPGKSSNPHWRPFFRRYSFGSKLGTKIVKNSNLALLHVL